MGLSEANGRGASRPWVGRSYAHLVLPVPSLTDELLAELSGRLSTDGWQPVTEKAAGDNAENAEGPVLVRRWRHDSAGVLAVAVLGWYPLIATAGTDGRPTRRLRRAVRTVTEIALASGGRLVGDAELAGAVAGCADRWRKAVEARRVIEANRRRLEFRQCSSCGAWSAYGDVRCRECERRFSPADDTARDQQGAQAAAATAEAERTLGELARGEGLFGDWHPATTTEADTASETAESGVR